MIPRRTRGLIVTMLGLLAIGVLTIRPSPEAAEAAARVGFGCLYPCGDEGLRDAILNTLLFIPLGFGLGLLLPARPAWLVAVLTTVTVEFLQYSVVLGRDPSLRDVLTNALGGALGIWLVRHWPAVVFPPPGRSRALGLLALVAWFGIVAGSAAGIRPALPHSVWFGQWAPDLGHFEQWQGTLLDARVGPLPLPPTRMADPRPFQALLESDSGMVQVTIVTGPPPYRVAPIASVFDQAQREILVLGQVGNDLVFRMRTGLQAIELGGQMIRMRNFPGHRPGDTAVVQGGVRDGAWVLRASSGGLTRERRVAWSAGLAWTGLLPFRYSIGPFTPWLTALWLGGLLVPAGYWLGRASRASVVVLLLGATVAAGLGGAVALASLPPAAWSEWAAALTGGLIGLGLSRLPAPGE